ncbi:MAG: aldolase [Phycisphaerae bacterium]|nr:aldolase [Phycisphaerae bacterium]
MRSSVIKAKLARNEPVLLVCLNLHDPSVFELTSLMGFDGIWLDLEHHACSVETAAGLIRAARVGRSDVMARPGKGEFARLSRLLEIGAHGIMYPRCDSAEEAREVVDWAKFAPLGRRGIDGSNPDAPYCSMPAAEYIRRANEETFVVIQLEDEAAVDRADRIAEVDGVDVLFVGQADLSVLSGIPGEFGHPRVAAALEKVAAAARRAGKHWGTTSMSPDHTRHLLDRGASFICHQADILLVKRGFEQVQSQFAPLGFRFANALQGDQPGAA